MRDLSRSPIGSVVPIAGHDRRFDEDYEAETYIPDDLPVTVDLPTTTWMVVSHAASELGRLDAAARLIPRPQLVTRVAIRREAIGTSALEGTYAGLSELFAAEILPETDHPRPVPPNLREIVSYTQAADRAFEWIEERPITLNLISALQALIVKGTTSDGPDAGEIRKSQVFIGSEHRRVVDARFIPPPPGDRLQASCERWIAWLTDDEVRGNIQLIARVAMAHYQFETLHPFTDGNGRLGRLIAVLQMLQEHALRSPVLTVSPWLEERADEYRDHLFAVSETGDWAPWIEFFASAVAAEARSGHDRIMRLLELREQMGDQVRAAHPRARLAVEIAEDLIAYPVLSVSDAERRHGRSNQANRNAIENLLTLEILEPYDDSRYDRLFWCPRVFRAIDR